MKWISACGQFFVSLNRRQAHEQNCTKCQKAFELGLAQKDLSTDDD